jgi:type IV pilus assembly protein PilP
MTKLNTIPGSISILAMIFLLGGCGGRPEPPPEPKPVVKRMPVDSTAESTPGKPSESVAAGTGGVKAARSKPESPSDAKPGAKPDAKIDKPDTPKTPWMASIPGKLQGMIIPGTANRQETSAVKDGYDPKGKIDPFEPIFKTKPREVTAKKKKRKRRIPLTPLEKMELSQLKVMGIIRAETGNRALVEEASGKGYIVKKGTYIGLNEGVVSKILKDRIIVRETVENYYGEVKIRNRELKIQKPPGEM